MRWSEIMKSYLAEKSSNRFDTTMSWKGSNPPSYNSIQSNVPDYQKMLQSRYSSSGWSPGTSPPVRERYHGYSSSPPRSISPLSHQTGNSYTSYGEPKLYQPSKYGLVSDSQYDTYLDKDFAELNVQDTQDTINPIDSDLPDNRNTYDGTTYGYQQYDDDLYGQATSGQNYTPYTTNSANSADLDLEQPIASGGRTFASPPMKPMKNSLDLPNYNTHARSKDFSKETTIDYSSKDILGRGTVKPTRVTGHNYGSGIYHNTDDGFQGYGNDHVSYKHGSSDLRQWQKQHQNQIIQQQLDTAKGLYGKQHGGFDTLFKHLSTAEDGSEKWESVRKAADAIIKEKDMIIDKLKLQLESDSKHYEAKLRRALMSNKPNQDHNEVYQQLQDMEYKYATLKSEMDDLRRLKNSEIDDLERKLGATEHENQQIKAAFRDNKPGSESDEFRTQLLQLEQEKEDWRNKFLEMKESQHMMKENLDELQRYLSDLPTMEESVKNANELVKLREETTTHQQRIEKLEDKVFQGRKLLTTRDLKIEELKDKEDSLSEQVFKLNSEIDRIKSKGEGAALKQCQEELEEYKKENDILGSDLEKAKKLLETSHRKIRHLEVQHQNKIRQLEERLTQEEESVMALREESHVKDDQMNKLKKSMKELSSQNQDLMEQNLIQKEQIKHFEQQNSDENRRLQKRFVTEMGTCFAELQSLVQICMQRAEGKDPNMSVLLGVRSSAMESDDARGATAPIQENQTLKQWLTKLKELRSEIEKLRGMICNKYAEDMGDNFNCNTQ